MSGKPSPLVRIDRLRLLGSALQQPPRAWCRNRYRSCGGFPMIDDYRRTTQDTFSAPVPPCGPTFLYRRDCGNPRNRGIHQ